MMKEVLSKKQGTVLVIVYTLGDVILLMTGLDAKKDTWLAILIGLVMGLALMYVYGEILSSYKAKNLFEISEIVFGRFGGKVICIIYIWYSLHLGALVLRTLDEFINTLGLGETPMIIPAICFMILCTWVAIEGIEVLGRWTEFFLLWYVLAFIILFFLSVSMIDITKLQPMFFDGIKPVLKGGFSAFAFPFGESAIFLMVFDSINKKDSSTRILVLGTLYSGLYLSFVAFRNIGALGIYVLLNDYFPTYSVISKINVGSFLQRLEIVISLVFLIGIFVKISLCVLAASKGVAKLFNIDNYRFIVVPISLLMLNLSIFVYENIIELNSAPAKIWPYYSLPFQVFIPLLIFVIIKFKKKGDKNV